MASQLVRQWLILSLIPKSAPGIEVSALESRLFAAGIGIHRRTIQRDLVDLSKVFPLVAAGREKPFRWHWADDARFLCSIPVLDATDEPGVEIALRLRVEAPVARYVADGLRGRSVAAREVTSLKKDRAYVEVLARVVDTCTLRRWLLGFADSIEIVSPEHVRADVRDKAASIARRYTTAEGTMSG